MQHFRSYDLDKDGSIDGLEIMKAAHKMNGELVIVFKFLFSDEHFNFFILEDHAEGEFSSSIMDLVDETDETMKAYDDNNDGIISYGEFYKNHMKALRGESH